MRPSKLGERMKVNHPGGQLRAYNYMGRRNKMVDAVIFFVFEN
jgi:hypothetical protein